MTNTTTQCAWCGRILKSYSGHGTPYCPGCQAEEAKALQKIVKASNAKPCQNAIEYSVSTGLPVRIIEHFIDNGKLRIRH